MGAKQAWIFVRAGLFLSELAAWIATLATALLGDWRWAAASAAFAVSADVVGRAWSRKSPVPLPYFMWWLLLLPEARIHRRTSGASWSLDLGNASWKSARAWAYTLW